MTNKPASFRISSSLQALTAVIPPPAQFKWAIFIIFISTVSERVWKMLQHNAVTAGSHPDVSV